jgi:quercetin dioxygenase-like cupin family protein
VQEDVMAARFWSIQRRLSLALGLLLLAAAAGAAQQQGQPAPPAAAGRGNFAANFTGTVAVQPTEGTNMSRIRFEASARTNWHLHTAPQILLIEEGRGRWQEQGDAVKELPTGQWQQPVTDAEYKGR